MPLGINDLQSMMTLDPSLWAQGQQVMGQGLQANDLANQHQSLQNIFDEQNNPLLVQHQGLMNTARQLNNANQSMVNDVMAAGLPEEKEAKRQKWLKEASDDQLKTMLSDAQAMGVKAAATGDADLQAKSERMRKASWTEIDKREKAAAEQTRTETMANAKQDVAETMAGARKYAADQALEGARLRAQRANNQAKTIMDNIVSGKFDYQKAATSYGMLASMEEDPERARQYSALAQKFEAAQAANVNRMAGKPDLAKLGIDVNEFQSVLGNIPRVTPPAAPVAAPVQGGSAPTMNSNMSAGPTNNDRVNILYQEYQKATGADKEAVGRELQRLGVDPAKLSGGAAPTAKQRTVTRTGTLNGKKVIQYSDGTVEYAD